MAIRIPRLTPENSPSAAKWIDTQRVILERRRAAAQSELDQVNTELKALGAYATAIGASVQLPAPAGKGGVHASGGRRAAKRISPSPAIFAAIKKHPISAGDIIAGLGAKGDAKQVASVRNALNYLKRSKQAKQDRAGLYHAA